jgi:pimeloyl-ACP methyl ester carboxylesterase
MTDQLLMRSGRKLEIHEYGDPHGHPIFFFHGLIGSHYQASYIADEAREAGLRLIAPNRAGVGKSEFTRRTTPLEAVADVEDVAAALGLDEFNVIGISGGTPYALATLYRLDSRVKTITVISGMGPMRLPGALHGMDRRRRVFLEIGARYPRVSLRAFHKAQVRFRENPDRTLGRLIQTWSASDQRLFEREDVYGLFMRDLHEVFTAGIGAAGLAQELSLYRNYGFSLRDLPRDKRITLWHGLEDTIVPPAMAWKMTKALPNCETHFVSGGHFMAIEAAPQIVARLCQHLDQQAASNSKVSVNA